MKSIKYISTAIIASLILSGCYKEPGLVKDNSYNRTKTGALTGALAGALTGYNTKGKKKGKRALIGGLLGGAVGGVVGYSLDEQANKIAKALGTGVDNDPLALLDPNKTLIVSKTDTYVKIMFRDPMMFASGSDSLQYRAKTKVNKVGTLLANYPQTVVGVAGFTDNKGSYSYNQKLSERRANRVADILSQNGKPFTKGCAYNKAIAPNNSATNRALNRRVEVYLYSDKKNMITPCR